MALPSEKSFPGMPVQIQLQCVVQQQAIPYSKWPISIENEYAYNIDKILHSSVSKLSSYSSWESRVTEWKDWNQRAEYEI